MEEKNLSTIYHLNFLNNSRCNIQKHCLIILNAMHKWQFLTKLSKNTWLPMWMIPHLTGTNGCQLWCWPTTPVIIPQLLQHCLSFCSDSRQDCHHIQLQTLNDITTVNPLLQSNSKCCTRLANWLNKQQQSKGRNTNSAMIKKQQLTNFQSVKMFGSVTQPPLVKMPSFHLIGLVLTKLLMSMTPRPN